MKRIYNYIVNEKTVAKFLIVGTMGFIVNVIVLTLLHQELALNLLIAQLLSAETAILVNFFFHNRWTYSDAKDASLIKRLVEFHASSWSGSMIVTIILLSLVHFAHFHYLIALSIGGVVAMFWNFFWTRFYVWKAREENYTK